MIETTTIRSTSARRAASCRFRAAVVKNRVAGACSGDGPVAASTTPSTPVSASASPSPVITSTPFERETSTTSWPLSLSASTVWWPTRPVAPATAIFLDDCMTDTSLVEPGSTQSRLPEAGPPKPSSHGYRAAPEGTARNPVRLRGDPADAGTPVRQRRARVAARELRRTRGVGDVLLERARLADVLGGHPDRAAVDCGGAVVTPPRPRRIAERLVAGEAVLRPGSPAVHADISRAVGDAERRPGRAREDGRADQGEGHHAAAARQHADRRVRDVRVADRQRPLAHQRAVNPSIGDARPDDVPGDAGAAVRGRPDTRVERAPQSTRGIANLLHAGVVRVQHLELLVVRGLLGRIEQVLPAARTERRRQ